MLQVEPDRRRAAGARRISRRWSRRRTRSELYVNLITSGIPADRARLARLAAAGLDSVQLSVQDVDAARRRLDRRARRPRRQAGGRRRRRARSGLPLTLNVVLHRGNIARVAEFVALAERIGAERLELANTQYLGWALANRDALLPSRADIERGARRRRGRRASGCAARSRSCSCAPTTTPIARAPAWTAGRAATSSSRPTAWCCRATRRAASPGSPSRTSATGRWRRSGATRPRCARSAARTGCRRRAGPATSGTRDFGGCRCQAFALLGDAAATDPACALSPRHDVVRAARARADAPPAHAPAPPPIRLRRMRPSA